MKALEFFMDKKIEKDLVCYCFGYSEDDIAEDVIKNGRSTIMERIAREKATGGCSCAEKNPKRRWCFGDVRQVVNRVRPGNKTLDSY